MKVLLTLPLSAFSGYGRDGIGITRAFLKAGADVYLRAKVVQSPLPPEICALFEKTLAAPFDLSITHVDPMAMELPPDVEVSTKMNIAWTMWEWPNIAHMKGRSTLGARLRKFDAVVTYDEVTREAFQPIYRGPLLKQIGGSEFHNWPYMERNWDEEQFYFGMVGAPLSARKNPFASIKAFSQLKADDAEFNDKARLMLKTSRDDIGLSPRMQDVYPGLRVFADTWDDEMMKEFYQSLHVLLSPSRGEGKHLPSLEFLASGGPVIGTNWGGMAEWMSEEYAYPLNDLTLEAMDSAHRKSPNASVSIEELKEHMFSAFTDRETAKQKGLRGSQLIPQEYSWDAVVEKLMAQLKPLDGGAELWDMFRQDKTRVAEAQDG